jgi:hypothetical protein
MAGSAATVVFDLPEFDTGEYEGASFEMADGNARLAIRVAGRPDFVVVFKRARWHQFTALPNCTPEMVRDSYFRLVSYPGSVEVSRFINRDRSGAKAYSGLSHFRIFLDETGCHELYAESALAV